jgi:predicted nucleotidyltransferase
LIDLGIEASPLSLPNNILAIEYCKAIISQKSPLNPHVILRQGRYHDTTLDKNNPSATALRQEIMQNGDWKSYIPNTQCFDSATIHDIKYGDRAIQYRLRTMTDGEFEALPYGSEGLWRKLMHASRECSTLEDVITATKSKRYTRSRIDRMIMCAFLEITNQMLSAQTPYVRVLGFNDKGRHILKNARRNGSFLNVGETQVNPYQALEDRCGSLYGLFAEKAEKPDIENEYRVFYNA